ncbi:MAG: protein NO VEIN domain-containing protein [Flagellimonas sp.]
MKEFVIKLKEGKIDLFKRDYHEMVAAYNGEAATTRGYNGRQILELLQNCDDQKSDSVLIKMDRENRILSMANKGVPFSREGYRSLTTSNLSSKIDKAQYIGNKGLGFRSVLNWSSEIAIYSNGFKVSYSDMQRESMFLNMFDQKIIAEIRNKYKYPETISPIPMLAVPEVIETGMYNEYAAVIELRFKEDALQKIIDQINAITPETILFLHNIKSITFEGFEDKKDIHIERKTTNLIKGSVQQITSNGEAWDIFHDEGILPNEFQNNQETVENYQIRIAVPRNEPKSSYRLYSFFATSINLSFPYIIHATFDLDQNRKHLENSAKNRFVVEKLTHLMCKMALYRTDDKVDWTAFKLLQYKNENENLQELGFYHKLDEILQNEKIVPCASDAYYPLTEAVYLSEDFSSLIEKGNGGNVFKRHIKPLVTGINFYDSKLKPKYAGYQHFVDLIDNWSKTITDISVRAKLTQYLIRRNNAKGLSDTFNVLIKGDGVVIDKKNEIFTHLNDELEIPSFCRIDVLHPTLFDELVSVFGIKEDTKRDRARILQNHLKSIGNVHSYEFIPLSRKIVNNTNLHISEKPEEKNTTVKQMLSALFNNFNPETSSTSIGILDVPIFDSSGQIAKSSDLYFSPQYPIGEICSDIFGDLHKSRPQVASPNVLGLTDSTFVNLEIFLSWLGVNKFVNYKQLTINSPHHKYVKRVVGYAPTSASTQVLDFEDRDQILSALTIEQFLLWVIKDINLSDNLNQIERKHGEVVKFKYHSNYSKSHYKSYLAEFVELSFYNFKNHLLDNTFKSINDIEIDYSSNLFKKYNVKRKDLDIVLRHLGACTDFNDLTIERVQEILENINVLYPNGRNSSTYYRRAYLHFEENKAPLNKEIKLFARDHEGLKLFRQSEIYFSDKVKLPNKLRANFPIFNFSKRSGGKGAIEFFGINDLSTIVIELDDFKKDDFSTKLVHDFLVELFPYILIHRVNALDNEAAKRKEAAKLQQLVINVCNEVVTKVGNNKFVLDNYEFIFLENSGYYLKLPISGSLESFRKQPEFKDAIADILSHVFDVSGHKSDFRALLSTDLEDVRHTSNVNFGEDLIDETLHILGFSSSIIAFWTTIYRTKGLDLNFNEDNTVEIAQLNRDLELTLSSHLPDYNFLNHKGNVTYLKGLFSALGINIEDFNTYSVNSIDMYDNHFKMLTNYFINNFNHFKQSLHSSLGTSDLRKSFLQRLHDFEVGSDLYIKRIALENRYVFTVELNTIFNDFLKKEFNEIILIDLNDFKDIDSIYIKNKSSLTERELEILDSSKSLESLLYFDIDIESFKKDLSPSEPKIIVPIKPDLASTQNKPLREQRISSFETKRWSGYKNRKDLYNPNNSFKGSNSQIGKTSEEKVYQHLCDKYSKEFVHYKAREDEGLHYDIRYSPDNGSKYLYVEVKTFSNDSFIISREEYEFGKDKKDEYEIWLVKQDNVIIFDHKLEEMDLLVKDYYVIFSELEIV